MCYQCNGMLCHLDVVQMYNTMYVHTMYEYDENVAALKKLLKLKSPAAQTIQDLLKATRDVRLKWLSSSPVSIHDMKSTRTSTTKMGKYM